MNHLHPGVPILRALTPAMIQQFSLSEAYQKLGVTRYMSPIQLQMCSEQITMLKERVSFLTEEEKNIFSQHTFKYKTPSQQQSIKFLKSLRQQNNALQINLRNYKAGIIISKEERQRQNRNNQQNVSLPQKLFYHFKAVLSRPFDQIQKDSQVTLDCEIDIQQKQKLLQNQQSQMLKKQR